jgi:sarcosine oxidase subunit alpha
VSCTIKINGQPHEVLEGTSVASALSQAGITRRSVTGEPRGPLCGMGVCFECRVQVGDKKLVRACLVPCADGMEIRT